MTIKQSALNALRTSRSVQIGLGVGLAYIILTWGLYQSWTGSLEAYLSGAENPNAQGAPRQSIFLKLLSWPLPGPATVENGGAMPFWSVLLQGIWIGVVTWAGFAQTNRKLIALLLPPFIVLFLISGNIISSLLVGASGLLIIAVIWGIIRGVRRKTAP
ncbi:MULTISPECIES: hypothetical protein [Salipiger]|uniref:hypothetical protein n=1 Tax=Salipiger TaxID=263377 RepID=UPI003517851D